MPSLFWPCVGLLLDHIGPKIAARWIQDGSKMAPSWPQQGRGWTQDGQDDLNMTHEAPKLAKEGPDTAPRWPQNHPSRPKHGRQVPPTCQGAGGMAQASWILQVGTASNPSAGWLSHGT
jgi:hypothetical protein